MRKSIQISDHFTFRKLLIFALPTILMMLTASLYAVVDGLFVANYAGKASFAAVNLIWPFPMIIGAFGYMFGSGGCALVSKILGECNKTRARGIFTSLVILAFLSSLLLSVGGYIHIEDVVIYLGVSEGNNLYDECVVYGRLIMCSMPFFVLLITWQPFMIAAEKPQWGLIITFISGGVNIILDTIFIYFMNKGVIGAGIATLISQMVGAILPIFYFIFWKPSDLYFSRPIWDWSAIKKVCANGLSEFIINVSMPIVNLLYIFFLWQIAGENGVGAYGVIMYVNMVFFSVFTGFSMGTAPIISFHLGARQMNEVKNIRKLSFYFLTISALSIVILSQLLAPFIAYGFSREDDIFRNVIYEAFAIYAFSFLFAPFNIFASSFFTALNNGRISAAIAISRILFFQVGAMLLLPIWFHLHGFWMSLPVAEILCLCLTIYFYKTRQSIYNY